MDFDIRINGGVVSSFHIKRVSTRLVEDNELGEYEWVCYRYREGQQDEDRLSGKVLHWVHKGAEVLAQRVLEEYDVERIIHDYGRRPSTAT